MSINSCNRFDKLDELIQQHHEKGIKVLMLYKLLKEKVKKQIDNATFSKWTTLINRLCIEKAIELVENSVDNPTEDDIQKLLSKIVDKE